MEWLWQNPIADMSGPAFLFFYACASAATIAACALVARRLDWTGRLPPPQVPPSPDPYEIAYLRGGENEVARAAVFALMRGGYLHVREQGKKSIIERTGKPAPTASLGPFERRAYGWFDHPRESSEVFQDGGLAEKLRLHYAGYEQKLRGENLLTLPEVGERVQLVRLLGVVVIGGLGAYKLAVALSRGRTNVFFLILIGAAAIFLLFKACRSPRLSRRGRAHLERLRTAFDRLKGAGTVLSETASTADERGGHSYPGGLDPSLLALGVFGVAALAGADHSNYTRAFSHSTAKADTSGSSCGSSCGSSDSSSGGDSSGGDGGGSSCGGGCGGCGGGE